MKKTEIDYNDVGTFPKFARVVTRILLEMLMHDEPKRPSRAVGQRQDDLPDRACHEAVWLQREESPAT